MELLLQKSKVNYVISQSSLPEKHSICSFTTSSSGREMSFNTTTAPIFFSSLPSFLAKMSSSSSSHENFSPLEHTNIHLQISFLTQIFLPPCDERACIQPAATYWAKSEGWQGEGGLSFPLCCHVIVNEPIKIIQKTKSDKRRRKPT